MKTIQHPSHYHTSSACKSFVFALTGVALLFTQAATTAAERTWDGGAGGDGNWSAAANWGGTTPVADDLLTFAGNVQTTTTNNFTAGTPFNNVAVANGAGSFSLNGNSLLLTAPTDAGGGLVAGGSIENSSANAQTIGIPLTLSGGMHYVAVGVGAGALNLNGALSRNNDSAVIFSDGVNANGSGLANVNGILGGWATLGGNWAMVDGSENVVAYADYLDIAGDAVIADDAVSNLRITNNGGNITLSSSVTHINSLLFSSGSGNQTVDVGAGNTLVLGQNGGIFSATGIDGDTIRIVDIGSSVANGGNLTAGDGVNPATIYLSGAPFGSTSTGLRVRSGIQDNGGGAVSLVILGGYMNIDGANTHSGGTYILQGRVSQPTAKTWGTGPVYIFAGGHANLGDGTTVSTNDFFIAGVGTTEADGLGALRLYNNTVISGTVTLMADAAVGIHQGTMDTLSGKITGPGGLTACHGNSANGAGTLQIGALSGGTVVANDYAGDTVVKGVSGGGRPSVLQIADPADNNIMPHGSTGSYNGGPTGNLILDGNDATRTATFELNGSSQIINGLSSTSTSPENNFVTDSIGVGALTLGDNNASGDFRGSLQGITSLTKIGTGTQAIIGANTYTGGTIINAGKLITSTDSSGAGNFTVADNASLGVLATTAGGTLQINNLVLGASKLHLNAGTFGNPSAPIATVSGSFQMTSPVTLQFSGVGLTPGTFTVVSYNPASYTGGGTLSLETFSRVTATVTNDTVLGQIKVTITAAEPSIEWVGNVTTDWDINDAANTTWKGTVSGSATEYRQEELGSDAVVFKDAATDTTVDLTTDLAPASISVDNTVSNYVFTGAGGLTGPAALTKAGTGTLTIANDGANSIEGGINVIAGKVILLNEENSGVGGGAIAGGATVQVGDNGGTGSLMGGVILNDGTILFLRTNYFAVNASLSGAGSVIKSNSNTLTLGGSGDFTGDVLVRGGTLKAGSGGAPFGVGPGSVVVTDPGTMYDVNGQTAGEKNVTVTGAGIGGLGAIINSAGGNNNALQHVTLAGNTTFGGTGRWDIRGTGATLDTGNQAYNLTKIGPNQVTLVGVIVDPVLGDIDVQEGILGVETTTTLGADASTLTVFSGATLQFYNSTVSFFKNFVLNGNGVDSTVHVAEGAGTSIAGPVTLNGGCVFSDTEADELITLSGGLSGGGSLMKTGPGGCDILVTAATYTGATTVESGTLYINATKSGGMGIAVNGGTLAGNNNFLGTITEPVDVLAGGSLSPGDTITPVGTLLIGSTLNLAGTTVMDTAKFAGVIDPSYTDLITNVTMLTFGGTLQVVTNDASEPLAVGDAIKFFSFNSASGTFSQILPATPGDGLAWDQSTINTDGRLRVTTAPVEPPDITNIEVSGSDLVASGTSSETAGSMYYVLTGTDVTEPVANWTPVQTNLFGSGGIFSFTNAIDPNTPQRYFLIQVP